jgi:LysR family transcriptional regulator of gallate degradation
MSPSNHGIHKISLKNLKSALVVARCRNVTKAAQELNRSQTAVTKAIGQLESAVGQRLFERSSSGMSLTVYGEALVCRVENIERELTAAADAYQRHVKNDLHVKARSVFDMSFSHKRLAGLIALYELRDINNASESLGVTRAAIYTSVRHIELLLETELFYRSPDGATPTDYCHVLVRHIKLAFAEIRHGLDEIDSLCGATQGQLVIGALPYTRTFLTPRAINRLLRDHPQLDVTTREGPYSVMESALLCGDIDCMVGAIRPIPPGTPLTAQTLLEDRLSVIARADHPLIRRKTIRFQELQNAQWVLPNKNTPPRILFDTTLERHGMRIPEHAIETSSLSIIRGLLMESDRVALLSAHQIHYDRLYGLLDILPVELEETYRPIGIIMRSNSAPSPAARLFTEALQEEARGMSSQLNHH